MDLRRTLGLALAILLAAPAAGAGEGQPWALFLAHVGESDKPLPATIICVRCPSRQTIDQVLGNAGITRRQFEIPARTMAPIEAIVADLVPNTAPPTFPYGTYKVTLLRPDAKTEQALLDPKATRRMLARLRHTIPAHLGDLRRHLTNLQQRLLPPAP